MKEILSFPIHVFGHDVERNSDARLVESSAEHLLEVFEHLVEGQAALRIEHPVQHDVVERRDTGGIVVQKVVLIIVDGGELLSRELEKLPGEIQTTVVDMGESMPKNVFIEVRGPTAKIQ
jgi:hypothetical protein